MLKDDVRQKTTPAQKGLVVARGPECRTRTLIEDSDCRWTLALEEAEESTPARHCDGKLARPMLVDRRRVVACRGSLNNLNKSKK